MEEITICQKCGEDEALYSDGSKKDGTYRLICQSCFTKKFWSEYIAARQNGDKLDDGRLVARIDGSHYVIGDEDDPHWPRGCSGSKFTIKFASGPHAGKVVDTTNLWHQGTIPAEYQAYMPDNAEFIPQPIKSLMEGFTNANVSDQPHT